MREQDASDAPSEDIDDADVEDRPETDGPGETAVEDGDASATAADDAGTERGDVDAGASTETSHAESEATTGDERIEDVAVDEELLARIEDADPETIAREVAALRVEIEGMEGRLAEKDETIEELESKLARARADFKNYKKRAEKRREEERERATAGLVERLLGVHDNLRRALEQDEDVDIRGGVESTLAQFDDVLAAENVTPIEPEPGQEVDPHRHEVLVRVESDQPEGTIDEVHRVGYEMADTVVREAQVTVSDGSGADGD